MKFEKCLLVTGSNGLIGSEAIRFFAEKNWKTFGIDNDSRKYFFGKDASVVKNKIFLKKTIPTYHHYNVDIRDKKKVEKIFKENSFDLIIHAAAQPSHDWAAKEPEVDFSINAHGTLTLLEAFRKYCPKAVFVFTSTNKVYGDNPNNLPVYEYDARYEIPESHPYYQGIDETMSIDHCVHSLFGVSKTSADLMVQEYGKYFNLKTGVFRGGCLTGPAHTPTQMHGFLAYLVYSIVNDIPYKIFGYKGKQVRDNIYSWDVINVFYHFYKNPKYGEVYNLGGGRDRSVSIVEAIKKIEKILNKKAKVQYVNENRIGDHIWYISNMAKFGKDFPKWDYKYDIDRIISSLCSAALQKTKLL